MSVYSQEFAFGSGELWGTRTDVANSTPRRFGVLQDVTVTFDGEIKPLFGQYAYAIALARGKTKIELAPKFATIQGGTFTDLYFGLSLTAGETLVVDNTESHIGAATVNVTQGTAWLADLGVYYASSGVQLTYTASATPATAGTYHTGTAGGASAGSYNFAAADTVSLNFGYTYSAPSTGLGATITNPRMGTTPTFKCVFNSLFDGRQVTFTFNNCVSGKLALPTKIDDWVINDMMIQASADASGNVGTLSFGQ